MSKKILLPIYSFLVFAFGILSVKAAPALNVKTLDASIENNVLEVSGTTDAGVLAVTIMVYDENETSLITMETTSVDSSNKYKKSINLTNGKYVVKVANYDGGTYLKKIVEPGAKESNPPTYDGIMLWIILGVVSIIGIIGIVILRKKMNA